MKKAIVIGSGVAGLASAIRLQNKGYQTEVFEQSHTYGGKMGKITANGYQWDAGPSLFTLPNLVDELFVLSNENPRDYFNYKKLEESCRYFWEDGHSFFAPASQEEFIEAASESFNEKEEHLKSYLLSSEEKYRLTAPIFLDKSLHKVGTYLNKQTLQALIKAPTLGINTSLNQLNQQSFENPKLVQLFNRYATYNGSSPYKSPGIMSLIPTLEIKEGTYFPEGGIRTIADSLYKLAQKIGVEFHFNTAINRLEVENNRINRAFSSLGKHDADVFVSNMDIHFTYKNLLPQMKAPEKRLQAEKSSSAVIFYWGMNKEFEQLGLHNIFFSDNYQKEFSEIFDSKTTPSDPTIYINISSKLAKQHAPAGKENWFVMINLPATENQDWSQRIKEVRERAIKKLNRLLAVDIEALIETEDILDPLLIEKRTASHLGALYGSASHGKSAAFLRHPNYSQKLKNLWFCGGSVHPGGGIPLCLKSAKISSDLIPEA